MANPKGPKVELPEELVAELEQSAEELDAAEPLTTAGDSEATSPEPEEGDTDELAQLKDKYLRLAADFDNYKRRNLKERQELFNYGNENLIKELLPVVDNLERAIGHLRQAEEASEAKTLLEGVELTHRSLLTALTRSGVAEIEAAGSVFDPKLHEAVRQVESDEHAPGHVVEVLQTGYTLMDRLLRPALVVVASGVPLDSAEEEAD